MSLGSDLAQLACEAQVIERRLNAIVEHANRVIKAWETGEPEEVMDQLTSQLKDAIENPETPQTPR